MTVPGWSPVMQEVEQTFDQLTHWGERAKQSFAPAPGSALAADDEVFPWLATSDIAWQALCGAQDHLKGFRAWLEGSDPELFPIATFSLLRGALVGGALAAWVLFPDDVEVRVGRSLAAAADWYRNHLNYGQTVRSIVSDVQAHDAQMEHVRGRADSVRDLRATREPKAFKMTSVIEQVNAELWPHDNGRAVATKALWQAGSGDAHALGWSILTRSYDLTPLADGLGAFVGAPSDRDVADAYLCAYDFTAYGFHRLDELGGSAS